MPEFFDVQGKVEKQGDPDAVEDSTVEFVNQEDFPPEILDSIQREGSNLDSLENSNNGFINELVCRPEGKNTFTCEAVFHDAVVTADGLQTVENIVVRAEKKDVVRVKTEDVQVEDKVLKTK